MDLFSVKEASDLLGITPAAIYLAVNKGQLQSLRKRPLLFTSAALEAYKVEAAQRRTSSRFQVKKHIGAY